jgi:hypothetical protein
MYNVFVRADEGNRGNCGAVDELSEANRGDNDRVRRVRSSQLFKLSELGFVLLTIVMIRGCSLLLCLGLINLHF